MPVRVERLPNQPIIIATYQGRISVADLLEMFRQSALLMQEIDGHVYRITDAREIETSFAEVLNMLQEAKRGTPGSTSDPNITPVMVGHDKWLSMFSEGFRQKQYGGSALLTFATMEEALVYIQSLIEAGKR